MKINRRTIIFSVFVLLLVIMFSIWKSGFWDRVVRYEIEKSFFSEIIKSFSFQEDIDGDRIKEKVDFIVRYFPSRHYPVDGSIEISKNGKLVFQTDSLGYELDSCHVYDINHDGKIELVSRWFDVGDIYNFYIYRFTKNGFEELLSAFGWDVVISDINNDKNEEIIEYWEDTESTAEAYTGRIYSWNGKEYSLSDEDIPIEIDPLHGDRLILDNNKVVVLK